MAAVSDMMAKMRKPSRSSRAHERHGRRAAILAAHPAQPAPCAAYAACQATSPSPTARCSSARSAGGRSRSRASGWAVTTSRPPRRCARSACRWTSTARRRGSRASASPGSGAATGALDCGNSGTTMRLFCGLLAGRPFASTLDRRSVALAPADGPGGEAVAPDGRAHRGPRGSGSSGRRILPPLVIQGGNLRGIDYALPVASAQLKSALVLAGLQATGKTTHRGAGAVARPHRAHAALPRRAHRQRPRRAADRGRSGGVERRAGRALPWRCPAISRRPPSCWSRPRWCPAATSPSSRSGSIPRAPACSMCSARDGAPTSRSPRPPRPWASRSAGCACATRGRCGPPASRGELALRSIDEIPALAVAGRAGRGPLGVRRPGRAAREGVGSHRLHRARACGAPGSPSRRSPDGLHGQRQRGTPSTGRPRRARSRSPHRHGRRRARPALR